MNPEVSYDVFLSYNSADRGAVIELAQKLKAKDLSVFLDDRELRPGLPVQKGLSYGLEKAKSVAVIVGPSGIGPWQEAEIEDAISEQIRSGRPVIPVLLPGVSPDQVPRFLQRQNRIDFASRPEKEELARLYWGITGIKPPELTPSPPPPPRPRAPGLTPAERAANTLKTLLGSTNITFVIGGTIRLEDPGFPPNDVEIASSLLKEAGLVSADQESPPLPIDTAANYFAIQYDVSGLEGRVKEIMAGRSARIPPVHQALAHLLSLLRKVPQPRGSNKSRQLIVTTNPDVLLERAMLGEGIPFARVIQNVNSGMLQTNNYAGIKRTNGSILFPGRLGLIRFGEPWGDLDNAIAVFGASERDLSPQELSFDNLSPEAQESSGSGLQSGIEPTVPPPILYKLRGSYDRYGTCALSSEQYLRFHIRAVERNLIPKKITEIVQQTPIVLLNYGYLDPDFRLASYTLLEKARETSTDPIYSLQTPKADNWPELALWERLKSTALKERKIDTIEEEGDRFLGRLIAALQPLAAIGRG